MARLQMAAHITNNLMYRLALFVLEIVFMYAQIWVGNSLLKWTQYGQTNSKFL